MEQQGKIPDEYLSGYDIWSEDWVSTSSLSLLMTCGIAWKKRYVDRLHEPTNVRMTAGTACHKGREVNLKQKIESQEDLSVDAVQDAARDKANDNFDNQEVNPEKDFRDKSKQDIRGIAVDMAVNFALADYEGFQTDLMPFVVEEAMAIRLPGMNRLVVGKIDTVDTDGFIDDLKTSKASKGQSFADSNMGLSTYGLLYRAHYGRLPKGYKIQNVIQSKTGTRVKEFEAQRDDAELDRQIARFASGLDVIKSGVFMPCDPSNWKCSEQYCGFWSGCRFGGGK